MRSGGIPCPTFPVNVPPPDNSTESIILKMALGMSGLVVGATLVLMSGCATIATSDNQPVAFNSDPPGAEVSINGVPQGITPMTIMLDRRAGDQMVQIHKDGYQDQQFKLQKHVAGMTYGNILMGGIVGVAVDAASGKARKFQDAVQVKLVPLGEAGALIVEGNAPAEQKKATAKQKKAAAIRMKTAGGREQAMTGGRGDTSTVQELGKPDTPARPPTGFYAADQLDFDILDGVTIDSRRGSITLFGHRTGSGNLRAVPYLDFLAAAVECNNPTFSLEWTPDSRRSIDQAFNMADQDLTDRLAGTFDRSGRLTARGEWWYRLFGVNVRAGMDKMSLWMAVFPVAGYPDAGRVMRAVDEVERTAGTPAEKVKVRHDDMSVPQIPLEHLISIATGLAVRMDEGDNLQTMAQYFNGGEVSAETWNQARETVWSWIFQGIAVAYRLDRYRYVNHYQSLERSGVDYGMAAEKTLNLSQDDTVEVQRNAFHALVSSRTFIHVPPDIMREVLGVSPVVVPVYDGLPANSLLGKVAFDADVFGKNLMDMPEIKPDVPGYRTYFEWRQTVDRAPATEGHTWLGPDGFELVESADGGTVRFGKTPVRIYMERYDRGAGMSGRQSVEDPLLRQYADELTALYEPLAAKFPVLLDLRESMKVMAVAEWLKQKGIRLSFPAEGRGNWSPPARYPGVIHMEMAIKQASIGEVISASGGIDYRVGQHLRLIQQRLDEQPGPPPANGVTLGYDPASGSVSLVRPPKLEDNQSKVASETPAAASRPEFTDVTRDGSSSKTRTAPAAAAPAPPTPEEEALRLWKAHDLAGAELRYRRLIDAAGGDVRRAAHFRVLLAEILHEEGNDEAAIKQLHEAVRLAPDLPDYPLLLGQSLAQSGDVAGAKKAVIKALSLDPDNQAAADLLRKLQDQTSGTAVTSAPSTPAGAAPQPVSDGTRVPLTPFPQALAAASDGTLERLKAGSGLPDIHVTPVKLSGGSTQPARATVIRQEITDLQKKMDDSVAREQEKQKEADQLQAAMAAAKDDELKRSELEAKAAQLKVERLQAEREATQLKEEIEKRKKLLIDTEVEESPPAQDQPKPPPAETPKSP